MNHQEERRRTPGRWSSRLLAKWTLIISISFVILSLSILEPLARSSVQDHGSKFDLPQTAQSNHSVGEDTQHFQSSEALSSNDAASDAAVESLKNNLLHCKLNLPHHLLKHRCSSFDNITNSSTHLFLYNPSIRDKFLCNSKLIVRPKSLTPLTYDDIHNKCGGGKDLMHEIAFRSHSFPQPPTMENRQQFPGILIENREKGKMPTKQVIASLRMQLSTAQNVSKQPTSDHLDDTFSSNFIEAKGKSLKPPKMYGYYNDDSFLPQEDNVLRSAEQCDVKCAAETSKGGIVFQQYVYGTDWLFTFSLEGEVCAIILALDCSCNLFSLLLHFFPC